MPSFTKTSMLVAGVLLGACVSAAQATDLRVSATPSFYGDMYRLLAEKFEAQHPDIKIKLEVVQGDQTPMLQTTLRQALVNDLPDVSFQGYNYLQTLSDQGLPVELGSFIAKDTEWTESNFSPSVVETGTLNGKVVALGAATAFPVIYYNADLVAEAQDGNDKLPEDWDSILSVAKRIQERHPDILGLYTRYNNFIFQGHIDSRGGRMMSPDNKTVTFTDQPCQDAAALLKRIGEAGQAKSDMTLDQLQQAFVGVRVAMNINSSSAIAGLTTKVGGSFRLRTAMLPMLSKNGKLPTAGVASMMFTHDPAKQDAAWQFMKFVSGRDGQVIIGRNTGYVPANKIAIRDPKLLGDYYAGNPAMPAALASAAYAVPAYSFPGSKSAMLENLVEQSLRDIVTLRKQPSDVLSDLKTAVSNALAN